ncbi:hypothetical protein [Streptomyces abikoensis]|uniref:hypothetical protein n=1 Tax=Streptomyces abikoensis TaxID=97398 RepID=UPI0016761BA6|nr:hypothetical protein [Streptomyces abikoensis]
MAGESLLTGHRCAATPRRIQRGARPPEPRVPARRRPRTTSRPRPLSAKENSQGLLL